MSNFSIFVTAFAVRRRVLTDLLLENERNEGRGERFQADVLNVALFMSEGRSIFIKSYCYVCFMLPLR